MAYNGWANYDTWNVALWFNNDYGMHTAMCDYVHCCDAHDKEPTYLDMCEWLGFEPTDETPDGVRYLGDSINTGELDVLLASTQESLAFYCSRVSAPRTNN